MPTSHAQSSTRLAVWSLVALCPLLAAGSTLAGAIALAAAVPVVVVAGCIVARIAGPSLPGAAGTAVVLVATTAIAAALALTVSAIWPASGDAAARYLPLAILGPLLVARDPDGRARWLRTAVVASASCAIALLAFAVAREVAGRMALVALTPAGAFLVLGVGLAAAARFRDERNARRTRAGPAA